MNVTHHARTRDSGIVCLHPAELGRSASKRPLTESSSWTSPRPTRHHLTNRR